MRALKVLVDIDDVMWSLLPTWLRYLNEKYGTSVDVEDVKVWDMRQAFPTLNAEQIFSALRDSHFWDDIAPIPEARETVLKFRAAGHKIMFVTASAFDTLPNKMRVFFALFPEFTPKDVIVTEQKQMIRGDVLIDDGPQNLAGGQYRKILFDAPYNRQFDDYINDWFRVKNWTDIERIINKISAGVL